MLRSAESSDGVTSVGSDVESSFPGVSSGVSESTIAVLLKIPVCVAFRNNFV